MYLPRFIAVTMLGLVLAGCSGGGGGAVPAQEFTKEDNAAVRQLVTDFVAAYNSKRSGQDRLVLRGFGRADAA